MKTITTVIISPINGANCIMFMFNVYAIDRDGNISGKSNTVIDGWWNEKECGPSPLLTAKRDNEADKSKPTDHPLFEGIKVYDATGRLIYEGDRRGFKPQRRGVFFIYENGKVKKEVVR